MRRKLRNPLLAKAYETEVHPCAIVKAGVLAEDDRSGVHFTHSWGWAAVYGAFKAADSESIAVVLTYDLKGLKLESDYDAKVERDHTDLSEYGYYIEEFDILEDPEYPDYERLADLLEDEDHDRSEEPPYYVSEELRPSPQAQAIFPVLADRLRGSYDDAELALKALQEKDPGVIPLEWFAEAIDQWRTFSDVGDDRLVRVEAVKPYHNEISNDEGEYDSCPLRYGLDDLNSFDADGDALERTTLWERGGRDPADVYYHGTDLTRAQSILADSPVVKALVNPWAPCVQPED